MLHQPAVLADAFSSMILSHIRPVLFLAVATSLLLLLWACGDNVGRLFDRDVGGPEPGESTVQRMVPEGTALDGRPRVREVFPEGNGWPVTVPVVVQFNETLNEESVVPTSGNPTLFLREEGGQQAIPASYDFLFGSRVVIIRPSTPLTGGTEVVTYEVVVSPELRDGDGTRYGGDAEGNVVATFTPDESDTIDDGEIVTTLPLDNSSDQLRETAVYAVFSKPVDTQSVSSGATGNFNLRQSVGGTLVAGSVSFPVGRPPVGPGNGDPRIAVFEPDTVLGAETQYELVVDDTITFNDGEGELDFRGRTPFMKFRTLAFEDVDSVVVGNPTPGFPDKVNLNNQGNLVIDVDLPASARVGDRVTVRLYGGDPDNTNTAAVKFVESSGVAAVNGDQIVKVSFAGQLGTAVKPGFREGELTIAAQLARGNRRAGYVLSSNANTPEFDITPPTLGQIGPPGIGSGNDFVTDQEHVVLVGQGSEELGAATLTVGANTVDAYAFAQDGGFMMKPLFLGRLSAAASYTLNLTDSAGNMATAPVMGDILQRGSVTGSVSGGTLVVEAYDEATFLPVSGVTVLVEPGMPQKPASNRVSGATDTAGRATFTGLTQSSYSVTLVVNGYHMTSLLDSPAGFVSLPLRPTSDATSTVRGTQNFQAGNGQSVLAGCNIIDDIRRESLNSTTAAPTALVSTDVRPNRPFVLTAMAGTFEPTTLPAFTNWACLICGPTGMTPTPAATAIEPDETATVNQTLLPSLTAARNLAGPYTKDFADSTGLDTANLTADPTVRVQTSLFGFGGQTTFGVGTATAGAGANWDINATYLVAATAVVVDLGPKLWVSTEATDTAGNIARHRRIIADPTLGLTLPGVDTPGVPTITSPAGPSTGSPAVTFQDRLDPADIPSNQGFGLQVVTATDTNGRMWRVMREDTNAKVGATTWQLPDLAGVSATGLANGTWNVRTESTLFFSLSMSAGDIMLEEARREEVTYSRAESVGFTIN